MLRIIAIILLALPLVSVAPPPVRYPLVTIARPTVQTQVIPRGRVGAARTIQGCSYDNAPIRLEQGVADPAGYPFGYVRTWRCDGDAGAAVAELGQRVSDLQAQAAAYRTEHPIK